MSKAALIFDEPQNCRECPCLIYYSNFDSFVCEVGRKLGKKWGYVNLNSRSDWCPLKPLPTKNPNNPELKPGVHYREDIYEVYKKGWNDFHDKIVN